MVGDVNVTSERSLSSSGIVGLPIRSSYEPVIATSAKTGLFVRSLYEPDVATDASDDASAFKSSSSLILSDDHVVLDAVTLSLISD